MIVSRIAFSSRIQSVKQVTLALRRANTRATVALAHVPCRAHSVDVISPNMRLITTDRQVRPKRGTKSATPRVVEASGRPLAVILPWLTSKPAAVFKYASLYLDQGFDVLTVSLHRWQTVLPVNGSQVVATELLEFLRLNYTSEPLMLHGFSIGSYLWGEVCNKVLANDPLYQPILDRVIGQVWDSGFFETVAFPNGLSSTVFPHNATLKAVMEGYLKYHMIAFHKIATKHYESASQQFFTNPVRAPALFLVSKADQISSVEVNRRAHDGWASRGVQTHWKCWDNSPHVEHFRWYPKEYAAELHAFFDMLGVVPKPEMIRAKM